ncbi:glycosyltransferase [Rhizorhapis sp. SPR117]|uniref:glycosyltransferase n=1 Tax=Rhizorhapis sp. SPR117 TaxID=2912611 RepID=UPI001F4817E2|nr:glycosyltransferase [Rhizorhapis sp. SPR117]
MSVWLSARWVEELAVITGWVFAIIAIGFIAYVPGFMNAFLISTLLFDRKPPFKQVEHYPGLTVLVAAYNEESAIKDTLTSLARQDYAGKLEVLVLNDGSKDGTASVVRETLTTLQLPGNISVQLLDFERNRGKSAVLNDGLRAASHDLIATVDGDCWVRTDGLTNIVRRMLSDPAGTEAIAGAVMVRNSRINLLTRAQEWDYFHGIAAVKRMQGMYHGTLVAQGAFSLYRRQSLEEVGGWPESVGEDIVVSWALLARGYRIGYAANALAFTNVPEEMRQFALQRKRWSRGLMEAFKLHWRLLFKKRMMTLFIWWNVLFLPLDLVYTFVFIPGLVLAMFGHFYIAGPLTLAVLPLSALWNTVIFRIQKDVFYRQELKVRRNIGGFLFYSLAYSLLMQPVCVWGYIVELLGMRKAWDTK